MKKHKELTDDERLAVYHDLLAVVRDGRIPKGAFMTTAAKFGVYWKTVSRIWKRQSTAGNSLDVVHAIKKDRKGKCGRKRVDAKSVNDALRAVPFSRRGTLRDCAEATGFKKSTLWDVLKRGEIDRISNTLKPVLTEKNKIERIRWAVSFIHPRTLMFEGMYDVVHLDEKWFYITEKKKTVYVAKGETPPLRSSKSARHMLKVMFLTAVTRPRFDSDGECTFDGKIGVWPIVETVLAKRNSRNRPAGTPELKSVNVTRELYKNMLIEKVLPAIYAKWPGRPPYKVRLQQDNAKAHVHLDNQEVHDSGHRNRSAIKLIAQPPNSPDFNILDLGFFRGIQSLRYKTPVQTLQGLIDAVQAAWDAYEPRKIDDNFVTLQKVLECSMLKHGGNNYALPHLHKRRRRNQGQAITNIQCDSAIYNLASNLLKEAE